MSFNNKNDTMFSHFRDIKNTTGDYKLDDFRWPCRCELQTCGIVMLTC